MNAIYLLLKPLFKIPMLSVLPSFRDSYGVDTVFQAEMLGKRQFEDQQVSLPCIQLWNGMCAIAQAAPRAFIRTKVKKCKGKN